MRNILFLIFVACSITISAVNDSLLVDSIQGLNSELISNQYEVTKADADSAYINNDFISAVELYEALLANKGESADVYYNLGNSYYKADNIAKAILNYERALLLKPGDHDIRFNLDMAMSKAIDKINPTSEVFFVTWFKNLANSMSESLWAKIAIAFFILFLISLSIYIFSRRIVLKKIGFATALIFLLFTVLGNIFAFYQKDLLLNRNDAIVIAPSVTVKSTPNESGTDLFILHEGHKVIVKDNSMREWKEIKLEDGKIGWVSSDVIEVI